MLKFGNTIKRLRKAEGLNLTDMAKLAGIQLATLSRMENNKMTGTIESHTAVAQILGFKLSEYFGEYEKDVLKTTRGHKKPFTVRQKRQFKPVLVGLLDMGRFNKKVGVKNLRILGNLRGLKYRQ